MIDLLFNLILLCLVHAQHIHFTVKQLPIFFFLLFLLYHSRVALLYEIFRCINFLLGAFRDD